MASLLIGCETVLYMANRLRAYMVFLHELPTTFTRFNFETAMTKLCACILQFLAQAIQIYQTPTFQRSLKAFWKDSDLQDFEQKCDKLGWDLEIEASSCDRTLASQDRERSQNVKQNLEKALKEIKYIHIIQSSLNRLEIKLDLDKLPYAKGAIFNSYDQDHTTCHPATRVDLLRQIQDWAQQPDSKSIFWLNGKAGMGKSTISWTIAQWLREQGHLGAIDLGASFFFKRGEGDRGSASRFFSTIARDLVRKVPGLDRLIAEIIASEPSIFDKALGEQFDKLIYQPLRKVNITPDRCPTLIVVVDALDECDKARDIEVILDLWFQLPQITTIRVKLFLTSRPDLPILQRFKKMSVDAHHDMILHNEVPRITIQHDIFIYLKDKFMEIREDYNADPPAGTPLDNDWPGDRVLQALANMAVPLFIVAATIYRFVGDSNWNPQERLETISQFQRTGELEQMERTYLPVLTQLPATLSNSRDTEKLYQEFRMIIGSIVTLAEPLSTASLAVLLNIAQDTVVLRLRPLHSVLQVPAGHETPVRTLHLSFRELLLSEKLRDRPFGVDGPATHKMLLMRCLELLSGSDGLRENLCDLQYPGQLRREIEPIIITERLTRTLQYACRYWIHHTERSIVRIHDNDEVHVFLQKHFLHWLEALSLMSRIAEVIGYIGVLQSIVSVSDFWKNILASSDVCG
jgi:NACHT domain